LDLQNYLRSLSKLNPNDTIISDNFYISLLHFSIMQLFIIILLFFIPIIGFNLADIANTHSWQTKLVHGKLGQFYSLSASMLDDSIKYGSLAKMLAMNQQNVTSENSKSHPDPRDQAIMTLQRQETENSTSPTYTLTIHGNGNITYEGIKNVDTVGTRNYRIPIEEARKLVAEFHNIYYEVLNEKYEDRTLNSSHPTVTTSFTIFGNSKTVVDEHGSDAPSVLRELEDKIDKVANSKHWINGYKGK
jgi:Domain of unknown function (DUF6438)